MGSEPEAGFNINVCRTLKSFHPAVGTVTSALKMLILKVFWMTISEELGGIYECSWCKESLKDHLKFVF